MPGTYWRIIGEMAQCGFLGTRDGLLWQEKLTAGETSFEEGFGDTIDKFQELIDAGAFDAADKEAKITTFRTIFLTARLLCPLR